MKRLYSTFQDATLAQADRTGWDAGIWVHHLVAESLDDALLELLDLEAPR